MDLKVPSPLVEAGIEQQACLVLYRFHEAKIRNLHTGLTQYRYIWRVNLYFSRYCHYN
ncbi:MAG: hypothetical protein O4753_09185 [Trichodesmium sp. St7_bin2_1]|nr:hypothetical protein [Trichodesmium sp. St7_bin2_1]